jgi:hypothetical protein
MDVELLDRRKAKVLGERLCALTVMVDTKSAKDALSLEDVPKHVGVLLEHYKTYLSISTGGNNAEMLERYYNEEWKAIDDFFHQKLITIRSVMSTHSGEKLRCALQSFPKASQDCTYVSFIANLVMHYFA